MCGIVGQVRADGRAVELSLLERMCAALEHRGPDARGAHLAGRAGLGVQRLRVIDLVTGDQPILNEDGRVAVVLNGEIYNFRELRRRLERSGHRFRSDGDTEAIVHLYEEEGPRCVRRLHGMFALAIWDARARRLVLARDRVGKKPLFYASRGQAITFASELRALMQDPEIARDLDHEALGAYLAYRCVPGPLSVFRGVRKLPPASTLVLEDGQAKIERYWRLRHRPKQSVVSRTELNEQIRDAIRGAVRRRMIADVPLGAFLSGGLDSSAVVAAMAEQSPRPVKTFSIGSKDERANELPLARLVASRFGTDHHELVVSPSAVEVLPAIVRQYGEPFADPSAIPSCYVARMARPSVTVALNGDGGDESFAGYGRYRASLLLHRLRRAPAPLRSAVAEAARRAPPDGASGSWPSRLRRLGAAMALDGPDRHAAYLCELKGGLDRGQLLTDEFREAMSNSYVRDKMRMHWEESSATSLLEVMMDVDVNTYLPDDLLVKMDIASMASSLETRSPFLDHELMEFAATLPARVKLQGGRTKAALREAVRGWVPDEVTAAPKRGFNVPVAEWLRGELAELTRDVLLDRGATDRGYFRPAYVRRLIDRHLARLDDHSQALWTLLVFELWHREFVDNASHDSAHGAPLELTGAG